MSVMHMLLLNFLFCQHVGWAIRPGLCGIGIIGSVFWSTFLYAVDLPDSATHPIDFVRDIEPLLTKHCLKCHGPETDKSGFRVDIKRIVMEGADLYGPVVVPGKSAESPLVRLVAGLEDGMQMPPEGDPLSNEEISLLRGWIDQGAEWPPSAGALDTDLRKTHWAFQPLHAVPIPAAGRSGGNPIDAFLEASMREQNLPLLPQASKQVLLRRLSCDLLGLPPASGEADAFALDASDDAWEKLVDRMLASPHFGERWARHWLDVVRFAESDGFETNQPRPNAWRYRDWVIGAFNSDMPFDEFVRCQLVGDMLGADEATGFIVGGPWDRVKSPDPVLTANQRADELHDMVSTTASTFLGLTVGCARCHNHKFDPIPQTDYYAMKAIFAGVEHGDRPIMSADALERQKTLESLQATLAPITKRLTQFNPHCRIGRTLMIDDDSSEVAGIRQLIPRIGLQLHQPGTGRGEASDPGTVDRLPNLARNYSYWNNVAGRDLFLWSPHVEGRFCIWVSWGCGWNTHAEDARYILDIDGDPATTDDQQEIFVADHRHFSDASGEVSSQPLWSGFAFAGEHDLKETSSVVLRGGSTDAYVTADLICFQEALPPMASQSTGSGTPLLRSSVTRGNNVESFPDIETAFVRFSITETSQLEPCIDELEIFSLDGRNVALDASPSSSGDFPQNPLHTLKHINDGRYGNAWSWISDEFGRGWVQLAFAKREWINRIEWSRDRENVPRYEDRLAIGYRIEVSLDGMQWQPIASSDDRLPYARYKNVKVPTLGPLDAQTRDEVNRLTQEKMQIDVTVASLNRVPSAYAGRFVEPAPTHRMHRGDPMSPRESIPPGGLIAFGQPLHLTDEATNQQRRRALADWIVSPDHPLTARVIVNRLWHYHFGTGLVDTPSDFGINGGRPTHPQLLDWLAGELVKQGWRLKPIHRLIVTSQAFKRSSESQAGPLAIDAQSRWLWRYPPRRLEAEALRDSILAASGALDIRMGGPGFDLFVPNTNYVKVYETKTGFLPEDYRRMIYQQKPRVELDTLFGAFDCPDAGQIAPRRTVSTTALQALNLLNSQFVLDQSDLFAKRLARESGPELSAQIARAFEIAFGRAALADEIADGTELARLHGMPSVCRAIFNSNEFIIID